MLRQCNHETVGLQGTFLTHKCNARMHPMQSREHTTTPCSGPGLSGPDQLEEGLPGLVEDT